MSTKAILSLALLSAVKLPSCLAQQNSTLPVHIKTWCTNMWNNDGNCPPAAICVPSDDSKGPNGEDGYCACSFYDSGFKDHYSLNSNGSMELSSCVTTTLSHISIAYYLFIAVCSFAISFRYAQQIYRARRDKLFRWDVLGTSTTLLFLAALLLGATRTSRVVLLSAVLNNNKSFYAMFSLAHILFSVALSFLMVSGTIFFAVSTLGILSRASVMMGLQSQKPVAKSGGHKVGVVCGLGIALGVCISSFTNQFHINALVIACGAMLTFCSYGFLSRSVTTLLRKRPAQRNEELRIPALHIISSVSRRLAATFVLLLACSIALSVCWIIGRRDRNERLLQYGLSIVVMVQYGTLLLLTTILGFAVSELWAFKLKQSHMIKRGISIAWKDAAIRPTVSGADPAPVHVQRKPSLLQGLMVRRAISEAQQVTRKKSQEPRHSDELHTTSTGALKFQATPTPIVSFGVGQPIAEKGQESDRVLLSVDRASSYNPDTPQEDHAGQQQRHAEQNSFKQLRQHDSAVVVIDEPDQATPEQFDNGFALEP